MPLTDATTLFVEIINSLKKGKINLHSPLEEIVIKTCGKKLSYVDNRKDARQAFGFDFWSDLSEDWLKSKGIQKTLLYSQSNHFPDFLFKVNKQGEKIIGGSLVELKDSKAGSIASFNSTIPTKNKSLEEIDVVNGDHLVSRIATIMDGKLATDESHFKLERKCIYLIRTYRDTEKVKVSLVDGSFFETIPKEHLFYQMLMNTLRAHLEKKRIEIAPEALKKIEEAFSYINDQSIIAKSQTIEKASVKPRLRIMAEVHPEGNPHSNHYPEITNCSFNLILQSTPEVKELEKELSRQIPEIESFSINHKRNGKHIVFQFKKDTRLTRFVR
jgi:hypothetical protein